MKVEGHPRKGEEFEFHDATLSMKAPIIALVEGGAVYGTSFKQVEHLPDETTVIACWHGQWKTDGFLTTVGELRAKAGPIVEKHEREKKRRAADRKAEKQKTGKKA